MGNNTIDAAMLRKMFLSGARNLELKKEWINELNVFPVPDGDTGTNMTLTIMSAAGEITALPEDAGIEDLSKAISGGSLRGARGNSGVILSQLFRGFTKTIRDEEKLDKQLIARAMTKAVETAYKAVMKPKEGTILTVAKAMADKASEIAGRDEELAAFFNSILEAGRETLQRTPEMLPVLKEAGVVDSGGQGLMVVLEGCVDAFNGKELDLTFEAAPTGAKTREKSAGHEEDIKFGYCTEFIISLDRPFPESEELKLKSFFVSIGDSLVLVADDDIVKVHVHTNHPGLAFEKGLEYGSLSRMKVDNMRLEHEELIYKEDGAASDKARAQRDDENRPEAKKAERCENAVITVTAGGGLSEIFTALGVKYVIEGGQTMNPSTDDMMSAIREVNAECVYILPNNKNVILAANQAAEMAEDCKVFVVPSKTIPQGIAAMIDFDPAASPEENVAKMNECIAKVSTIEVTYAVRDTKLNGKEIRVGDIMAIGDEGLLSVGKSVEDAALEAIRSQVTEDSEIISIYNGDEFSDEQAEKLRALVAEEFPDCDVELNYGGQPVYYCIISVE